MNTEVLWKAVSRRDPRFNGIFIYAVVSTGIYCKPSCAARRPKRKNVRFFFDHNDAETAGYRACKRCRPQSESPEPAVTAVITACEILERSNGTPLQELASEVGLSPSHFQKTFKEIIGVSPRKYGEAMKVRSFKEGIKGGSTVTDAMYDAGFGSSSRLYEKASEGLGMTPATFRKGGKGMAIEYAVADSDLGKILVARTKHGICAVNFGDTEKELTGGLAAEYPEADISPDRGGSAKYLEPILKNLRGTRKRLALPLDLQATAFQLRVWEALREIPYGETASYSDIAKKIGNPKAVRAVAGACAANKVALVIPCHRVVKSNGDTSGYKWGKKRKEMLLEKESQNA